MEGAHNIKRKIVWWNYGHVSGIIWSKKCIYYNLKKEPQMFQMTLHHHHALWLWESMWNSNCLFSTMKSPFGLCFDNNFVKAVLFCRNFEVWDKLWDKSFPIPPLHFLTEEERAREKVLIEKRLTSVRAKEIQQGASLKKEEEKIWLIPKSYVSACKRDIEGVPLEQLANFWLSPKYDVSTYKEYIEGVP